MKPTVEWRNGTKRYGRTNYKTRPNEAACRKREAEAVAHSEKHPERQAQHPLEVWTEARSVTAWVKV